MVVKVRKQIYIEPHQDALLKRLAGELKVTEAEIIRQAIDRYTRSTRFSKPDLSIWEREKSFITRLMQQGPVPGKRTWKRESLHER